jgi:hypothetical protein
MKKNLLVSIFYLLLFNTVNAQQGVVTDGNAKFTVLSPILIKTEYSGDGIFETKKSFNITNLDLPTPTYTSIVNDGWLEIRTDKLLLRYKQNSGSFSASNLKVSLTVKGQLVEATPWFGGTAEYKSEAENLALFGGASLAADHSGYSGSGFVAGYIKVGPGLQWDLNENISGGDYNFILKYCNGMGNDRTVSLYIDGVKTQITLSPTANWDTWGIFRKKISLSTGSHSIKVVCDADDTYNVNIDYLALSPVPTVNTVNEAESAILEGGVSVDTNHPAYTGTGFASGFENSGPAITWRFDQPLANGDYTISMQYANGTGGDGQLTTRTMSLYIDGVKSQIALPPTDNWDTWNVFQQNVSLSAGPHIIKISYDNGDSGKVNIDWLGVSPVGQPLPNTIGKFQKTNLGGGIRSLDLKSGETPLWDGLMSKDGWHLIDDSKTALTEADGWVSSRPSHSGGYQDGYFFGYGTDYQSALKDFYKITGNPPLLPKWAFGVWYSKYAPYTSDFYKNTLLPRFRTEKVPLDVLVVDTDWKSPDKWNGWSWDNNLFPDPQSFINWGKGEGLAIALNIHPSILSNDPKFAAADATAGGGLLGRVGDRLSFDYSKKSHAKAYFDLHTQFNNQGIRFWWLDWVDQTVNTEVKGLPVEAWLSHLYVKNMEDRNMRGFAFSRIGGGYNGYGNSGVPDMAWSDHRYTLHFTGDTFDDWSLLKFASKFTIREGNLGIPYVSHDMGSFKGRTLSDDKYIRWLQFGTFQPIFRLHADENTDSNRLPWQYPNVINQAKDFIRLRHALVPYTYSLAHESSNGGLPIVRGMYFYHPESPEAYSFDKQYFYGENILVSPIVTAGETASTSVWFPNGKWTNYFTNEVVTGPATKTVTVNYSAMPAYIKAGGIIPLKPYTDFIGQKLDDLLTLKVYAGADGDFSLYEDEGDNRNYQAGNYALTRLTYDDAQQKLTIPTQQGTYNGAPQKRAYDIVLYNAVIPTKVLLNDIALNVIAPNSGEGWWIANGIVYVHLNEAPVLDNKVISFEKTSLGMPDPIYQKGLQVYPNPVINSFFFNKEMKGINVRIFSVMGSLVAQQKVDANNSINVSKLSSGIYFVVTNKDGKENSIKIIKK